MEDAGMEYMWKIEDSATNDETGKNEKVVLNASFCYLNTCLKYFFSYWLI